MGSETSVQYAPEPGRQQMAPNGKGARAEIGGPGMSQEMVRCAMLESNTKFKDTTDGMHQCVGVAIWHWALPVADVRLCLACRTHEAPHICPGAARGVAEVGRRRPRLLQRRTRPRCATRTDRERSRHLRRRPAASDGIRDYKLPPSGRTVAPVSY